MKNERNCTVFNILQAKCRFLLFTQVLSSTENIMFSLMMNSSGRQDFWRVAAAHRRFLHAHPDSICTKKLINVMKGLSAVQCTSTYYIHTYVHKYLQNRYICKYVCMYVVYETSYSVYGNCNLRTIIHYKVLIQTLSLIDLLGEYRRY